MADYSTEELEKIADKFRSDTSGIRGTKDFTSPEELYDELKKEIKKYHPSDDTSLVDKAYRVAYDAHKGQARKSGEPYIIHPLCVAIILAELELDKETIAAGLLHDVLEDTIMTMDEMRAEFGDDVCIQNLHVIFAIDRAGLVGSDGETHQGIFDISYLSVIPNMTIMAPKNKWELSDMMKFAVAYDGPIALRYPRGAAYDGLKEIRQPIELAKSELIRKGSTVAIMALGSMVKTAVDVVKLLEAEGITATLINARFCNAF